MTRNTTQLEAVLTELGNARAAGALNAVDAGRLPWKSPVDAGSVDVVIARIGPRRRLAWGMAIAASFTAAVVALWQFESQPNRIPVTNENTNALVLASRDAGAVNDMPVDVALVLEDFNQDGRIDGEDIQPYLDRVRRSSGEVGTDTSDFVRKLLGS